MTAALVAGLVAALALTGAPATAASAPVGGSAGTSVTTVGTDRSGSGDADRDATEDAAREALRRVAKHGHRPNAWRTETPGVPLPAYRIKHAAPTFQLETLNRDNPLADRTWGVYKGDREFSWEPYEQATGETQRILGGIALQPKAAWFGGWQSQGDIGQYVRDYIAASQNGDPEALVQMTVFRMEPNYHDACGRLPSGSEIASYKQWIDTFADALGDAHVALVLQPDGPFALCTPDGGATWGSLVKYAAERFSAHENTSVYIEIGSWDWPAPGQGGVGSVLKFLLPAGIESARGIALNGTHYADTSLEIQRAADVIEALDAQGITGKKAVINTANSGNPFEFGHYQGPDPDNAWTCTSISDPRTCVSLGIPPGSDVDNPDWGLSDDVADLADEYVDGYVWFGRPWLYRQNYPFEMDRALALVRSSPYYDKLVD